LKDPKGVHTRANAAAVAAAAAAAAADFASPRPHPSQQSQPTQGIRLSQFSGEFFRPTVEHSKLPRAVLTFDGAHEQIESVLSEDVAEWCIEHHIALFKWAAACSLVQQPNDVSRCHKILHRLFASPKYLYQPVRKDHIRTCLYPVIAMLNSLPKLAKDSKLTFTKFLCNLHDILHDAFRPEVVRRGWSDAGIYPFSVEQIMSGWNHGATKTNKSWAMLDAEYKEFCLTAISKLREPARSGQLLDAVIENVVVREAGPNLCELTLLDAMNLAEAGDPDYMKVHIQGQTAINHNRCLHLTAAEFFSRIRAAQALNEDFDSIVSEFGRGCPCKNPPLKSTGKAHLKATTHDKAFNKPDGKFFGMSVRAAFMLPVDVVIVQGAPRIGGDDDAADGEQEQNNEVEMFDELDPEPEDFSDAGADAAAAAAAAAADDDDVSEIVGGEDE
jgi:hypothetical protein